MDRIPIPECISNPRNAKLHENPPLILIGIVMVVNLVICESVLSIYVILSVEGGFADNSHPTDNLPFPLDR
jgi:Na+/H+ antiporter NhaC